MIKAILLDLSGVLYIGNKPIPGALEAIHQLHTHNLPLRFITNTTRSTRVDIIKKLSAMEFEIDENQLFTTPLAAKEYIKKRNLKPYLLIHSNLLSEFSDFGDNEFNCVLVGDAGTDFTYEKLNTAFRYVFSGAPLLAMGKNRYFKEEDGFSLDAGPFVYALEIATGQKATVLGKPAKEFFHTAIKNFGCRPGEAVMIGDDVDSDINGAFHAGLQTILVQTGKYKATDNQQIQDTETRIAKDIGEAVNLIINNTL